MIAAVWALWLKPTVARLFGATVGRWFGLIFIIGVSATSGAAVALAIVSKVP
ncbi:hypothetical protein [Streptomyces sp. NPDC058989]|uniref:hypothetical protein n=1 Tax=Streptomyces sp. NPDC058989 TaxID=3346686 RepID=UPI003688FD92